MVTRSGVLSGSYLWRVDIEGAKALKRRLGQNRADEAPPAPEADIAEAALPVFHWLGVSQAAPPSDPDDERDA
jgi:hypothetical protein